MKIHIGLLLVSSILSLQGMDKFFEQQQPYSSSTPITIPKSKIVGQSAFAAYMAMNLYAGGSQQSSTSPYTSDSAGPSPEFLKLVGTRGATDSTLARLHEQTSSTR